MKATYDDFLSENPPCRKFESDIDAQAVFHLLSQNENIIAMIDASEAGKPALTPVVSTVEGYFDTHTIGEFDPRKTFPRTVVGCMIKTILAPFGYRVLSPASRAQKDLPKAAKAKYFASSSCYELTGEASMRITRTVSEIK